MMEQISMYLTALPCPPLPARLLDGDAKDQIVSSHDLFAGLIVAAMVRNNKELNDIRKVKQNEITRALLDNCLASPNSKEMYKYCQQFTGEYLHAFDDAGASTPSVCFLNIEDVDKGDKVHSAASSWHAAQDILFVPKAQQRKATVFAKLSYAQLIDLHWSRVRDEPMMLLARADDD